MRKRWHEVIDRLPVAESSLVEVGVWRGDLTARLLASLSRLRVVLVDPWRAGNDNHEWRASGALLAGSSPADVDGAYRGVLDLVGQYATRARVLRMSSVEAAAYVPDGSCDAVFIDAIHTRAAVEADIAAWLPKVRAGGWIGGHDYGFPRFPGVAAAVDARFPVVQRGADWTWFAQVGGHS